MGKPKISDELVGIKNHQEMDMKSPDCCDSKYLGGQDPGEYALKQEDMLAANVRKHRAK